ncbi:hypothetical protein SLS58_008754 [Diplodia intermedia]|uniref:Uncharacterized protein n=1 Tax=Diplodia intermedia TaxID=856260 RepID=A0ABR3TGS4_9PEZI
MNYQENFGFRPQGFAEAKDLREHQAARNSCEFQKHQFNYGDGFDQEQKGRLKKRKRTGGTVTDEDKWRDIYLMLFPGEQAVPEPHSHATDLDGFHKYWQDNSDRVFQEKASEIPNGSRGVPMHLMKKLVDDMHEQILEEFQALQHDDDRSSCTSRASTPMSSPSPRTPLSFEDPPPTADNAELHMPKRRRMENTEESRERLFGEVMEGEAYYSNHVSMQYGHQGAQPPRIILSPACDAFAEANRIIPLGIPDGAQRVQSHVANNAMLAPDHALPTNPSPGMLASQMVDWYDLFTFGGNDLGG